MRPNPLFYYLQCYQRQLITPRLGYLMVSLSNPLVTPSIQIKDREMTFTSNHISVYETYDEGTGYNSLYHYTANFDGFVVHVYFDRNGQQSDAYIKEESQEFKSTAELLPQSEKTIIQDLLAQVALPVLDQLNKLHTNQITELSKSYYQGLKDLYTRLYDESMNVEDNRGAITRLIELGEALHHISYNHRERNLSLPYLKKQFHALSKTLENMKIDAVEDSQVNSFSEEASEDVCLAQNDTTVVAILAKEAKCSAGLMSCEATRQLYQDFETSYDRIEALINSYDALLFSDFQKKISILHQSTATLADLLAQVEMFNLADPVVTPGQNLLHKAGLGLDYLFHNCETKGTLLLTLILSSSKERLDMYGPSLSNYSRFVSSDCIDSTIKKGKFHALKYLMDDGLLDVNRYCVKLTPDARPLSMICIAYQLNHLEMFIGLVRLNANLFSVYQDDLPLAHTLYNLPLNNPFRQGMIEHSAYYREKTGDFFSSLTRMIRNKLSCTVALPTEKQEELSHLLDLYETLKDFGPSAVSKQALRQAHQITQQFDQSVFEKLKKSPEYIFKLNTIKHLYKQFFQILRRQHQESRIQADNNRVLANINKQLEENTHLQQCMQGISAEQIVKGMDMNISQLEDYIFVLNNRNKPLSKKKKKQYDETLRRIDRYEQEPPPVDSEQFKTIRGCLLDAKSALKDLTRRFEEMSKASRRIDRYEQEPPPVDSEQFKTIRGCLLDAKSALKDLTRRYEEMSKPSMAAIDAEDEFSGVDFLSAAEESCTF